MNIEFILQLINDSYYNLAFIWHISFYSFGAEEILEWLSVSTDNYKDPFVFCKVVWMLLIMLVILTLDDMAKHFNVKHGNLTQSLE